ncbi:MAG: tRNA-(ms[2]io[6]A)-hydroxylase [Saprospiraceae bacterium]|nr:tRNA-(ms[2]io[6]A)-hydroxylase [Saprospiraceae bacterium]
MKKTLDLRVESSTEWLNAVLNDFNTFLQDHADCERKASAMAMSLVAKYPDRSFIHNELIDTAIEELEHFKMVYELMQSRGVPFSSNIQEDPYIKNLNRQMHSGGDKRFMDYLLIGSLFETRGAERFRLIEENLSDPDYKKFYKMLWTSEAKHGHIYINMALHYFPEEIVYDRMEWWIDREAEVVNALPIRAALH